MFRRVVLLAAFLGVAAACSSQELEIAPEVLDAVDIDNDGVVSREAVAQAELDAQLEAEQAAEAAQLEAERAEREAERAVQQAAVQAVLEQPDAVAASFPGGQLSVAEVRASLATSPPSLMDDPGNPTHEEFVSRLTSMLQLRLAGVALDGLGFEVDVGATDEEINAQVEAHLAGPFEEFAQQRTIEEDPSIERLATPHCVSALTVPSQGDATAASARVQAGEAMSDVAGEVNLPGLTGVDGTIGCDPPLDLFGGGDLVLALLELDVGELTEPVLLPSAASPSGELWVVLRLDELRTDATDLASIGPFAGRVLTEIMPTLEVSVDPALGTWSAAELRVSLPFYP